MSHNLGHAWRKQLSFLLSHGSPIGPRGLVTNETLDWTLTYDGRYGLLDCPPRGLNYRFAVAEWVWMMFGHSAVAPLAQFNSVMKQFSDDGVWLTGAYGPHICGQRERVLRKLRHDPNTRQAVIDIPRPNGETKDEPCTLSLQFLQRNGYLHLIVTMRSSDIWLGVPYDAYTFAQILACFAGELKLPRGLITLHAGSSHLYERDFTRAREVIFETPWYYRGQEHELLETLKLPYLPGMPPPWLEPILLDPIAWRDRVAHLNVVKQEDEPWLDYARVLTSPDSVMARDVLRAASVNAMSSHNEPTPVV